MKKIKCALIGPGNIGTDLLYKLQRSSVLEPVWMVGIDATSEGLQRAAAMGIKTSSDGVDGLLPHVEADDIRIAFDATSAYAHADHSRQTDRARSADDRPDAGRHRPVLRAAGEPA